MTQKTNPLFERFTKERSTKVQDLAEQSSSGFKSGFQGIFQVKRASDEERGLLRSALEIYNPPRPDAFQSDVEKLMQLMLEVKAISHQALLLHGQRIQSAREVLREYREGAFTMWLVRAYGNRQTPYNFLQYFEFFQALPAQYRSKVEKMPRQVIYQLASRKQSFSKKLALLERCGDYSARSFLRQLRSDLPLKPLDQRRGAHPVCSALGRAKDLLMTQGVEMDQEQLATARQLIQNLHDFLHKTLKQS